MIKNKLIMEELLEKIRNNDQSITHLVVTQLSLFYIKVRTNEFEFLTEDKMTLMEALKTNKTITHLVLNDILFINSAIRLLVEVLKINTTITHLDLSNTAVGFESIKLLTDVLKTNKTIVNLNLRGNNFNSFVSMELLAKMLKVNRSITCLDLRENNIHELDITKFKSNIQSNGIISQFIVTPVAVGTHKFHAFRLLQNLLQRNQKMHNRARQCIIELLCIKKYRQRECLYLNQIDRNVMLMIAKEVWKSRGDFDYWEEEKTNKRIKV